MREGPPPTGAPKYCDVMIDPQLLLQKSAARCKIVNQKLHLLQNELDRLNQEIETAQEQRDQLDAKKQTKMIDNLTAKITLLTKNQKATMAEIEKLKSGAGFELNGELDKICSYCGIGCIKLEPLFPQLDWEWLNVPPSSGGIKYRPLLPYRLEIELSDNLIIKTIYLPNEAPVITLDVTRPAWADQVTTLVFEKGVLTQAILNRPSETLAFLKIPVDLVKAIVGLPMDLIKFRVDNITQGNQLLQAQIDEIKLKQQLLELKQNQR